MGTNCGQKPQIVLLFAYKVLLNSDGVDSAVWPNRPNLCLSGEGMAWLYQRGKKWWIGYYDENGKRVRRSIGDSREVAEVALKRVESEMKKSNPDYGVLGSDEKGAAAEIDLQGPTQRLTTYPAVRSVVNVRELFARIYEQLGFEVLKSQEDFPHYVLAVEGKPICAHVVVRCRDFLALNLDIQACDRIICWINDWPDAPIPVLELSQYYDFY